MFLSARMILLLILVLPVAHGIDQDLVSCCPVPLASCSVRSPCCIELCRSLEVGARFGEESIDISGCCPPSDPCGEEAENTCRLCNCPEDEDLFLRAGFQEENQDDNSSYSGLERDSGKEFMPLQLEESSGDGLFGRMGNVDFMFGEEEEREVDEVEVEKEKPNGDEFCCPTPDQPCGVRHPCCIRLCSALQLGTRGDFGEINDGCCPPSDPCGELLETGNCILCSCDYRNLELAERAGFNNDGWEETEDGGMTGLVRESGGQVLTNQVRLG